MTKLTMTKNLFTTVIITTFAFAVNITASAEDTTKVSADWTPVQYNDGVRYSQWVIDSRISDFRANAKERGFNAYDAAGKKVKNCLGPSAFDYVPGLVAKAIIEAAGYYAGQPWARPWYYSIESYANSCYDDAPAIGKSQDDMNAAKMYFPLRELALGAYKDIADPQTVSNAEWAIGNIGRAFKDLNKKYVISDSILAPAAGGWWHKSSYKNQMWCDGLYMGAALMSQMVNYKKVDYITGAEATDWDLITKQFQISWSFLWDKDKQLLWHAFTAAPGDKASKDWAGIGKQADGSMVYHSAAYWGRACGWYFLALCDILEQMQIAGQQKNPDYAVLKGYLNQLAAGLAARQDAKTGCWYQLLDETDKFSCDTYRGEKFPETKNYLESSCTSIFTAAYIKGMRLGLLDKAKYDGVAKKAYKGFVEQFIMQQPDGTVQLIHNCASAGLGGKDQRDASKAYYLLGPDIAQRNTYTEGKVLGGFILAAIEYERAYESQRPVMLSEDLLPEYKVGQALIVKVSSTTKEEPTYKWLMIKNSKKKSKIVEVGYESTFTPEKPGQYYCQVSCEGKDVVTNIAEVK